MVTTATNVIVMLLPLGLRFLNFHVVMGEANNTDV
jgi:hypothetical protein